MLNYTIQLNHMDMGNSLSVWPRMHYYHNYILSFFFSCNILLFILHLYYLWSALS